MKTLIISSSLSKNSRSFVLCKEVQNELLSKKANVTFVDARNTLINAYHKNDTEDKKWLSDLIKQSDNIIIGMGIHCFSISDNLKIILDNCFENATGKFFGILCAAGGQKSYLATQHLTQICMNEWRMIQLPRVIYATSNDFDEMELTSVEIKKRIKLFSNEFYSIGKKLLN